MRHPPPDICMSRASRFFIDRKFLGGCDIVFNEEGSCLPCFCWDIRDRPRQRCCLIPSLPAKRKRVCCREQPTPTGVRRENDDMQSSSGRRQPLWQRGEDVGAELNLTVRPGLWGGGEEYNP